MAHLYSLRIHHYRGIQDLDVTFGNTKFVVIIGRGDSGKTTILKAIAAVLSPNWNLSFSDWDFYQCNTEDPIVIEAVVKDLPDELLTQNKYGLCFGLLKNDGTITYEVADIPEDQQDQYEKILTIRLTVSENLEPKWTVISGPNHDIETEISASDRAKLRMYQVSDYIDNHFSYSKGSPLFSLLRKDVDNKNAAGEKILAMVRNAFKVIKEDNAFVEFNEVRDAIVKQAKDLGLNLTDLSTLVEFKENAYSESNITLHSNGIPYRLHGKGSKRLLSIAIQRGLVEEGGIMLIDELEQGMEPDRSRNLARLLKQTKKGQVFVTTHSRAVLVEVSDDCLFLLHDDGNGFVRFSGIHQRMLRRIPEAVLAKRVICCEGLTETGIIRSFDDFLLEKRGFGLAAQGIVYVNSGGGNKFYTDAIRLKEKGIDACVMADDDTDKDLEKAINEAKKNNVAGVICEKGKAIEDMLFAYLPWNTMGDLLRFAEKEKTHSGVFPILTYTTIESIEAVTDEEEQNKIRNECAEKATSKSGSWYKSIDGGEYVGNLWLRNLHIMDKDCGLRKEFDEMMKWIGDDIN